MAPGLHEAPYRRPISETTMSRKQSGFTLVEIAIVLVIIGLLLGGVLKGQELVNSAKVKNFISDFRSTQLLIYGYQDKFKAIPGDDVNAVAMRDRIDIIARDGLELVLVSVNQQLGRSEIADEIFHLGAVHQLLSLQHTAE